MSSNSPGSRPFSSGTYNFQSTLRRRLDNESMVNKKCRTSSWNHDLHFSIAYACGSYMSHPVLFEFIKPKVNCGKRDHQSPSCMQKSLGSISITAANEIIHQKERSPPHMLAIFHGERWRSPWRITNAIILIDYSDPQFVFNCGPSQLHNFTTRLHASSHHERTLITTDDEQNGKRARADGRASTETLCEKKKKNLALCEKKKKAKINLVPAWQW